VLLNLLKKEDYFLEQGRLHCSFVPLMGIKNVSVTNDLQELVISNQRIKTSKSPRKGERDSLFSTT
jgi:hypothetical protein